MKNIKDDERKTKYQYEIDGNVIDIYYKKDSKNIIIIIKTNILSSDNYLLNIGSIYKEAVSSIDNFSSVVFEFHPENDIELKKAEEAIKQFGLTNVSLINPSVDKKQQMIENYFNANIINKNSNGSTVNYAVREADSTNSEYLLENIDLDDIKIELGELLREGKINIEELDEKAITNVVLDRISNKRKQHVLESANKYDAKNEYEQASLNATNQDDLVNTEIGVVKKNPYDDDSNSYRTIERDGDNYNAVNPNVNEVSSIPSDSDNPTLASDETETREKEKIYYVDHYSGDIYNQEEEKIGNISEGYIINEENHLLLNGKDLGIIDEYSKSISKENVKVKKLVKPDNTDYGIINIKAFTTIMLIFLVLVITYLTLYLNR